MPRMTRLQNSSLLDIDDVAPLVDDDQRCLQDLHDVLARHGALERFGVTLLHKHFDVFDDEVLVETIDVENRTLTVRPVKATAVPSSIETMWRFDGPRGQRCERQCVSDRDHEGRPFHRGAHYTTG